LIEGSLILDEKGASFLQQQLPLYNSTTLLFRGSRDGFAASAFHLKCDNAGPTVTVIKSTTGRVFGGYTTKSWGGASSWITDSSAFLFSVT